MTPFIENIKVLLKAHISLIDPFSGSSIAIFFNYACYLFYQKIHPRLTKRYFITSALLEAIHWLLAVFIWVQAVAFVVNVFTSKMDDALVHLIWKLRDIGLTLLFAWIFVRFIKLFEEQLLLGHLAKKYPDKTTVQAIGKLLRVGAIIIVVPSILTLLGINVSGIVAFGGGSAIILGIGAQQIFTNYFGGLVIYADRNIKVGDWISSPDKDIEGQVEDIGWRATQLRTFDQKVCYLPNAVCLPSWLLTPAG